MKERSYSAEQMFKKYYRDKYADPNRYLKQKRISTNVKYIQSKGIHYNNGYYYDNTRLANVLNMTLMGVYLWVRDGKIPAGQFKVKIIKSYRYYWRFEEIYMLCYLLKGFYHYNDNYKLNMAAGRLLRDEIYEIFKYIYNYREKEGLEKYQPEF